MQAIAMTLPESLSYSAALLVGLAGSPHCIGMCGGIVSLFNLSARDGQAGSRGFSNNIIFQFGRVSCYTMLGAIAGATGAIALGERELVGVAFRWLSLLLLLSIALSVLGWWSPAKRLERAGSLLWQKLQPMARPLLQSSKKSRVYALGVLWGFLPCGLIYSTLAWSLTTGNTVQAALMMLCFGLGTMPALLGVGYMAGDLKRQMRRPAVRYSLALFLALLAFLPFYMHQMHAGHGSPTKMEHHRHK